MKAPLGLVLVVLAAAAAIPAGAAPAAHECQGIKTCIPVAGPWVQVEPTGETHWLLSCPQGQGVVGGLDALATSSAVRVEFAGRLGSPVAPGMTTTRNAYFTATVTGSRVREAFQPHIGCIPTGGGGGRSTVSARAVVPPGASPDRVAVTKALRPGRSTSLAVSCPKPEARVGSWAALAARTPAAQSALKSQIVVRARDGGMVISLGSGASRDLLAQVGVECAP